MQINGKSSAGKGVVQDEKQRHYGTGQFKLTKSLTIPARIQLLSTTKTEFVTLLMLLVLLIPEESRKKDRKTENNTFLLLNLHPIHGPRASQGRMFKIRNQENIELPEGRDCAYSNSFAVSSIVYRLAIHGQPISICNIPSSVQNKILINDHKNILNCVMLVLLLRKQKWM